MPAIFDEVRPDWVVIQGDTTTVAATAVAAFHQKIPVAHVEAGLRTGNMGNPFPEEFNRRLVSVVASLNFAPTRIARQNMLDEGMSQENILVTGNTVVDALNSVMEKIRSVELEFVPEDPNTRLITITLHRRESFGETFTGMMDGIRELAEKYGKSVLFVYPVHPNPNVDRPAREKLGGRENVLLIQPQDYMNFIALMSKSYLVLTDSGGIQEECPSLRVPVVVLRNHTERPEGIKSGHAKLAGTNKNDIIEIASEILENPELRDQMTRGDNPYGDGNASKRIVGELMKRTAEIS
jgi:UDP-N-acetylglucosamine 2-epimerase